MSDTYYTARYWDDGLNADSKRRGRWVFAVVGPTVPARGNRAAYHPVVYLDPPVRLVRVPASDSKALRPCTEDDGKAVNVKHAVKCLRKSARTFGILKPAADLLKAAIENQPVKETIMTEATNNETTTTVSKKTASKKTASKKTAPRKKTNAKAAAKKAAPRKKTNAKAAAKKAAPRKKTNAKAATRGVQGDGLGRPGTVAHTMRTLIKAGKGKEAALKEVRRKFPDSDIPDTYFAWYRRDMEQKGLL